MPAAWWLWIDGRTGGKALQVGAGVARVAVEREVAGREGIEEHDDDIGLTRGLYGGRIDGWKFQAGEHACPGRRTSEALRKSRRVKGEARVEWHGVRSEADQVAQQYHHQTQQAEGQVEIGKDRQTVSDRRDQAGQEGQAARRDRKIPGLRQ